MAATKLNGAQQAKVLDEIAIRYLRGERQVDIAAVLDLSQPQISYYLRKLQAAWLERAATALAAAQAQELAKIDELERVAWQEWEASRQPGTRTLRARQSKSYVVTGRKAKTLLAAVPTPPGASEAPAAPLVPPASGVQVTETVRSARRTTITRLGNPAYLQRVEWCITQRCALLGLTHLPPHEEPPVAVPPTDLDAAAVAAAEAVLLDAYTAQRARLVPELPPDGHPPHEGGDPL